MGKEAGKGWIAKQITCVDGITFGWVYVKRVEQNLEELQVLNSKLPLNSGERNARKLGAKTFRGTRNVHEYRKSLRETEEEGREEMKHTGMYARTS